MANGKSILILGASRGIGLGLAEEFAARGWQVVASERTRSEPLHALDGVDVVTADVTDPASYADLDLIDGRVHDVAEVASGVDGLAGRIEADAGLLETMATTLDGALSTFFADLEAVHAPVRVPDQVS